MVIVILALASSVVMLNAPPIRPESRDDAERFAARMQLAFDEAISSGAAMRVAIDASGYVFETMKAGEWTPITGVNAFDRKLFDKRSVATVELAEAAASNAEALGEDDDITTLADEEEGEDEKAIMRVTLDPLGAQTPFTVRFTSPDGAWIVSVSEGAKVTVSEDA